jgi:uncharacterized zinc-type alcohol dehydrogenase-like protein
MAIHGYAAYASGQALKPLSYEPGELRPQDVEVRVEYCGICHSDIHLIDDDWGMSRYPFIPGHEIIGTVSAAGSEAGHMKPGMRVGIGWQAGSCFWCEWCVRGEEHLCPDSVATCVKRHGGFADGVRVDAGFAFPIPQELDSAAAAPLLCGGITVYSPLRHYDVRPWHRVGVVGIGGLGHLATKFAHAFGCEVTAFSTTREKEAECRQFGADHFVLSTDANRMARTEGSLDFILTTPHTDLPWKEYLHALRPQGTMCFVGAPPSARLKISPTDLLTAEKRICGSVIGNRATIGEMLEFAGRHNIGAVVEVVPLAQANAAIEKVRAGRARYRMVLKA